MSMSMSLGTGTITIGGGLTVGRIGYGAMQLTGDQVWVRPRPRRRDRIAAARRRLRGDVPRQRRRLRPALERAIDPRSLPSVFGGSRDRDEGWFRTQRI